MNNIKEGKNPTAQTVQDQTVIAWLERELERVQRENTTLHTALQKLQQEVLRLREQNFLHELQLQALVPLELENFTDHGGIKQ